MAEIKQTLVPDMGDFDNVPVIEVLVAEGDTVKKDQSLVTLESQKSTIEVPSSYSGTVSSVKVRVGDTVNKGHVIALIDVGESEVAASVQPKNATTAASNHGVSVHVPDLGQLKNVHVIEILVQPGQNVEKNQSVCVLESDKTTMDVPSSVDGVVDVIHIKVGDSVSSDEKILTLTVGDVPRVAATSDPLASAPSVVAPQKTIEPMQQVPVSVDIPVQSTPPFSFGVQAVLPGSVPYASPIVRLRAREQGINLTQVRGTGKNGRITLDDLQAVVAQGQKNQPASHSASSGQLAPPILETDFSQYGTVTSKPLSRIQKISGSHLARNWTQIPHVTHFDVADITELEAFRRELHKDPQNKASKITLLAFLMKASAAALVAFPDFNASLDSSGQTLIQKKYVHIGFAADTPHGLMVPVIRDVLQKGVYEIAQNIFSLARKAHEGKLSPAEMSGGCFTISSLGSIGGTGFTPIINAPEVAILGVARSKMEPVWDGSAFIPRLMLPLSLSYDHRVIDGAMAARFVVHLAQMLTDMRRVLL